VLRVPFTVAQPGLVRRRSQVRGAETEPPALSASGPPAAAQSVLPQIRSSPEVTTTCSPPVITQAGPEVVTVTVMTTGTPAG